MDLATHFGVERDLLVGLYFAEQLNAASDVARLELGRFEIDGPSGGRETTT